MPPTYRSQCGTSCAAQNASRSTRSHRLHRETSSLQIGRQRDKTVIQRSRHLGIEGWPLQPKPAWRPFWCCSHCCFRPLGWPRSSTPSEFVINRVGTRSARSALPFDGPIHECDLCPTFATNSAVGRLLSLEMFSIVGDGVLLLGIQVFDGRLWRRSSAAGMAEPGADRKYHGRVDVRAFHGTSVCHRARAG